MSRIQQLTVTGYKSISMNEPLLLTNLNVVIGANGVGKTNLLSFFSLFDNVLSQSLPRWIIANGGAERLFPKSRHGSCLAASVYGFGQVIELVLSRGECSDFDEVEGTNQQSISLPGNNTLVLSTNISMQSNSASKTNRFSENTGDWRCFSYSLNDIVSVSSTRGTAILHDNEVLSANGQNLPSILIRMRDATPTTYTMLQNTFRLAHPFFNEFMFEIQQDFSGIDQVTLTWSQLSCEEIFDAGELSQGMWNFLYILVALLQPNTPDLLAIDSPEQGLHPKTLHLLAALLRSRSNDTQIVIATNSATLIDEFSPEDLVIADRRDGQTQFSRVSDESLSSWLEEYSLSELWRKNILGGNPSCMERSPGQLGAQENLF